MADERHPTLTPRALWKEVDDMANAPHHPEGDVNTEPFTARDARLLLVSPHGGAFGMRTGPPTSPCTAPSRPRDHLRARPGGTGAARRGWDEHVEWIDSRHQPSWSEIGPKPLRPGEGDLNVAGSCPPLQAVVQIRPESGCSQVNTSSRPSRKIDADHTLSRCSTGS